MHPRRRFFAGFVSAALILSLCAPGYSGGYYKWTDESGNLHISDSLGNVPEKYRNQIERKTYENESPSPAGQSDGVTSSSVQRDAEKGEERQPRRYEVPYAPYEGSAKRVIIKAVFNGSVTAPMAIDTGAPGTVISSSLAKKLGLFDEGQGRLLITTGGIGGSAPAVRSIIDTIQVGGAKIEFVPTTIIAPISDAFDGLLGLDFVSNYSVTIDSKGRWSYSKSFPGTRTIPAVMTGNGGPPCSGSLPPRAPPGRRTARPSIKRSGVQCAPSGTRTRTGRPLPMINTGRPKNFLTSLTDTRWRILSRCIGNNIEQGVSRLI